MVWRSTATNHLASIGNFARRWIAWSMLDRLIPVTILGWGWFLAISFLGISTGDLNIILFCAFILGPIPWLLWLFDGWLDSSTVKSDLNALLDSGAIIATRCEYLGGHPELPHGRFVYLMLDGTRQNPALTVVLPTSRDVENDLWDFDAMPLPLLDIEKTKEQKGAEESPAAEIVASINKSAGGLLRSEKLTLLIDYDSAGGRKRKVEFGNFFRGNSEVRTWQNFIVCAQEQATTDLEPYGPWQTLPEEPTPSSDLLQTSKELELGHAVSGNGHAERKRSSAFARR